MNNEHLDHIDHDMLEQYIAGELEPAGCTRLESHVDTCSACAEALTLHAQFETALFEAAEAPLELVPSSRVAGTQAGIAAAGLLAMAAAVLLFFGAPSGWIQIDGSGSSNSDSSSAVSSLAAFERDPACIGESTPEGIGCAEPLAVALATFPEEAGWDSFSPDDGNDLNWCAAEDEPDLVCIGN